MFNGTAGSVGEAIDWAAGWAPAWLVSVAILLLAAGAALALTRWSLRQLFRLAGRFTPFLQVLVTRSQGPICTVLVILALAAALSVVPLPSDVILGIARALLAAFVLAVGWNVINALNLAAELHLRRFRLDVEDNLLARKHVTQVRILLRTAQTLLVIVTLSAALMTFEQVRQYGVSLFASAGAAGLVLGLAARPLLSNLLAGIQIALTQPIRVEDAVVVEGEWGWVENIAATYVVIRLWDLRRLIVPLVYFIEKPFQNWTHESSDLLGTVLLRVDFTVPLERLREKLREVAESSRLWDRKVAVLQVTDASGDTMELRILVSARGGAHTFDLRCEVREKMIAFLQAEYPHALPRHRTQIVAGDEPEQVAGRRDRQAAPAGETVS